MKRIVAFFVAFIAITSAYAEVVTTDHALVMAREFISKGEARFNAGPGIALKLAHEARSLEGKPDYYVFNNGVDGGYIVVSGDDRTIPVWGYSISGTFDYESLPENAKWWLSEYQRQLQFLRDHPEAKARQVETLNTSMAPLLTTQWGQTTPYNYYCPEACENINQVYYENRACTGCVATALAQIMYHHKWPITGTGSNSYDAVIKGYLIHEDGTQEKYDRTEKLSVNYNRSIYNWSLMKRKYEAYKGENGKIRYKWMEDDGTWREHENNYGVANYLPINAVAKLMKDVGIAVEMEYGSPHRGGSGVTTTFYSNKIKNAMETYFGYQAQPKARLNNSSNWDDLLRAELSAGKPIYYQGFPDGSNIGHAFVFDGYDSEGYFHVNWGWGGDYDDNYLSSILNPGPYDYSYNQVAVFLTPMNGSYSEEPVKTLSVAMPKDNAGNVNKGAVLAYLPFTVYGNNLDREVTFTLSGPDADQFDLIPSSITAAMWSRWYVILKVARGSTMTLMMMRRLLS